MTQTARIDFSKGVNKVTESRLMPDGYSLVLDNVDLRSGSPRAFRFPTFYKTVSGGTTRIWEYRGKWYASDLWRDYAAEMVGNRERIYFTESGPGSVIPQKIIDGVQARLGTPPPGLPLEVAAGSEVNPMNLAYELVGGETPGFSAASSNSYYLEYMVAAMDENAVILALSNKVSALIEGPTSGIGVRLSWAAYQGATQYQVYGRAVGEMQGLIRLPDVQWTDANSQEPDGNPAPSATADQPTNYVYTFVRVVNGHRDESGPSPVSEDVTSAGSKIVTRNTAAERIFTSGGASLTFVNPTPSVDASASSQASAADIMGIVSSGGTTMFVASADHGLSDGDPVGFVGLLPADAKKSWKARVPNELSTPRDVSLLEIDSPGSTLPAGTYAVTITAVRGGKFSTSGSTGGIFVDGRGAQTTASVSKSITTTGTGKCIVIKCAEDTQADSAYVYINGTFQGVLEHSSGWVYNYTGQAAEFSGPGTPTVPATNETRRMCFYIQGLDGDNPKDYPDDGLGGKDWPQFIPNPTCQITLGTAHGVTGTRSVKMSNFTDDAINGVFTATITSTTTFTIPAFLEADQLSVTDPYTVVFSDATDDFQFYKYWRLYRTEAGEWQLVEELPLDVTTYEDKKDAKDLGEAPDSWYTDNDIEVIFRPPPSGLHGIVLNYGIDFGIYENTVRWTPVNRPDAWPDAFQVSFPYKPYALAPWGQEIIVLCSDALYKINGTIPTLMTRFKTKAEVGILAPRSVQKTEKGLLYLGAPGVMLFDGNTAICITENRIPASFWQSPSRLANAPNFFWYPTEITYNYAALAFDPGGYGYSGVPDGNPAVANIINKPIMGPIYNIRSFYHDGKYYLFWSDYVNNGEVLD